MILIALGANQPSDIGPPEATLRAALTALAGEGVEVAAISRFYRSPAWPDPSDPPYVNAVASARTILTPRQLMDALHRIEARFGRERRALNAPRTLDLDIADYEGRVESPAEGPVLPHPRAHERVFVLAPLLDVAPDWVHPELKIPGGALLTAAKAAGGVAETLD